MAILIRSPEGQLQVDSRKALLFALRSGLISGDDEVSFDEAKTWVPIQSLPDAGWHRRSGFQLSHWHALAAVVSLEGVAWLLGLLPIGIFVVSGTVVIHGLWVRYVKRDRRALRHW